MHKNQIGNLSHLLTGKNIKNFTCGTHFGETKLVASTTDNPEVANLFMSSIFTGVGTVFFSFCSPSRGPTSTIFTHLGRPCIILFAASILSWSDEAEKDL